MSDSDGRIIIGVEAIVLRDDNDEAPATTERDETFQHISRTDLPWRAATRTRCGLIVASLKPDALITVAEASAKFKRMGQQRASMFLCMSCCNKSSHYYWPEWDVDPVGRLARELGNGMGGRTDAADAKRLIELELRAVALLIEYHRGEFDELIELQRDGALVQMADLRTRAKGKRS